MSPIRRLLALFRDSDPHVRERAALAVTMALAAIAALVLIALDFAKSG
ncbi:MAG TPA: hypothetical protein VF134_00580 [Candidatus Dormibacteraeota bacterium]